MVEGMRILKDNNMEARELLITPERLSKLIEMIDRGVINRTKAKDVFERMCLEDVEPEDYVKSRGLEMISDEDTLRMVAMKVLEDNPRVVSDYKNGKTKALGNLVGLTMKAMNGKADPVLVNAILKEII
jgi:aspartyl-tRNA(Asn)/glutamyl-tRNA(Gln) amidotransferase subunit B